MESLPSAVPATCWWVPLSRADTRVAALLSRAASTRVNQLLRPADRARRMLAEVIVGATTADTRRLCPECLSTDHGAVVCTDGFVSVSHSGPVVAVVRSPVPVGIDVENATAIQVVTGKADPHTWTRREAGVKVRGVLSATVQLHTLGVAGVSALPPGVDPCDPVVHTRDIPPPQWAGADPYVASLAWAGEVEALTVTHRDGGELIDRLLE